MSPYLRRLEKRLDGIDKQLGDVNQRIARIVLHGKVSEVKHQDNAWHVRLEIGRDPETDQPILSPLAPAQPVSAGALKIKVRPTVGERMTLISPSGVLGTGSWAVHAPFDQDHPGPEGEQDVIIERGKSRITIEDGKIVTTTGKATVTLDDAKVRTAAEDVEVDGRIKLTGERLSHNDKNISHDHVHTNVDPGPGLSGPPA